MANRSTINSLIQRHIVPEIADNFYDGHPFFWQMERDHRFVEKDEDFSYPILKADGLTFRGYVGLEDITPTSPGDPVTDQDYAMGHFVYDFMIPYTDLLKGRGTGSAKDLLELHREHGVMSVVEGLATQLWTDQDQGQKVLLGIPRILSTTTSAEVGGLDTDAVSVWAPKNRAASGASNALQRADMEYIVVQTTFGIDGPKMALMNRDVYAKVLSLFTSNERFLNHEGLKAGFTSVELMGVPHYIDPKATGSGNGTADNIIAYLNPKWLRLAYNPADWFTSKEIGDNHLAQRAVGVQMFISLQHACLSRRNQGKVSAINPAS